MDFILIILSVMAFLLFVFMLGKPAENETQQDRINYMISFVATIIAIVIIYAIKSGVLG